MQKAVTVSQSTHAKRIEAVMDKVIPYSPYVIFGLYMAFMIFGGNFVFAAGTDFASIFKLMLTIVGFVASVFGVVYIVQGIFSYILAMNNENGPDMEKAIRKIVVGVVAVAFGASCVTLFASLATGLTLNLK